MPSLTWSWGSASSATEGCVFPALMIPGYIFLRPPYARNFNRNGLLYFICHNLHVSETFFFSHYLTFIIETALASPSKQLSQDLFIAIHMWACQGPAIIYERARSMCQRDMKRPVITVEDIARECDVIDLAAISSFPPIYAPLPPRTHILGCYGSLSLTRSLLL